MNNAKHTPGPWVVVFDADGGDHEVQCADAPIALVLGVDNFPCVDREDFEHCGYIDRVQRADARLIVAAPDLLAACEEVLASLGDYREIGNYDWEIAILRAAIAKALGGAS